MRKDIFSVGIVVSSIMITLYLQEYISAKTLTVAIAMPISGIVLQHYTMGFEEAVEDDYISKGAFTYFMYAVVGVFGLGATGVIGKNLLSITESLTAVPAVMYGTLIAIGEETLYRGWLLQWLIKRTKMPTISILFSSAVFTVCHTWLFPVASWASVLYVFMGGIILGSLYWFTGRLWPPTLAHIANNILAIL